MAHILVQDSGYSLKPKVVKESHDSFDLFCTTSPPSEETLSQASSSLTGELAEVYQVIKNSWVVDDILLSFYHHYAITLKEYLAGIESQHVGIVGISQDSFE